MKLKVNSSDYPALCEALQCVPAGRRRTLRLLTLAHVGALFERTPTPAAVQLTEAGPMPRHNGEASASTAFRLTAEQLADLGSWGSE
jgi:hypothetical protein